ncbi:DUF6624 domain-containing protein [Brevundimonas sp. NIBR11]|uniref:DUF6624 domain-containing protein n=1 Tax=Brevundimonas sp. NIBR11 TaxID=3015999 RepID=UPI0022F008AC|nr:DUF6624 domain-containing protein [Brevundimonas sp. NIBR11]WGM30951.1 hypothetical protein KKHFBJBL_01185 [Brevundimonas sp. NIBR11]
MVELMMALAIATQDVSPEVLARISPVQAAIDAEVARQAALPPARNDAERLDRMGAMDQVGRRGLIPIDLNDLPEGERQAANDALWAPVTAMDHRLTAKLLKMIPPKGWFLQSVYGRQGAGAAFLIIQHSELEHWRRFVPVLEPLVATGEVEGQSYGLMYDRLAINEGRPQRYGTQMTCVGGRWVIDRENLEDPENVEARREAMGFPWTLAEYEARFADYPACTPR